MATRVGGAFCVLLALALLAGSGAAMAQGDHDPYAGPRRALVAELRAMADARAGGRARIDAATLKLIERVPRHEYVPEAQRRHAYRNRPLGIGHGQTISQPYIVALMTTLARPGEGQRILEIGTGSGYQAAVLAESGAQVYSIEIIEPLARRAAQVLREQGQDNVVTRIGDGYYGWQEHAPFDAIVVTAAASSIPPPLVEQLKPGGRMVIPVGAAFMTQNLMLVEKDDDGRVRTRQILPVRFVPLTREAE
ncbi:protein-L-isoaspartate(D-aspartate) O-methyltransferase [Marilutibacter alkalisoli]|uniref:Protein-L-isoaspartate O-methyltransferase n=1 Tax=Marilutibacter alkalisoli TaxID=2591633 RepID=A0A514BVA7_9GAMM|nr:protein-L-isoaspartate(D-aspartate) O-methyltransferase [Lysobacter alkalisoli]QDH71306.1 protein-L-isoaspartate(D-aspartate) O-methyltransferase [Lysobacter alkalisoli]